MADFGDEDGAAGHGKIVIRWTPPMSRFMLARLVEIVEQGVKTNKGFKDAHFNQVARAMFEYAGIEMTRTQVYNHLRKWRGKWMKIEKLKDISGALWDEKQNIISLDDKHYLGYIRKHPNSAEFLNKLLENYKYMETIFQNGQATGKFAMGSNEVLGAQSKIGESATSEDNNGAAFGVDTGAAVDTTGKDSTSSSRKRKRAAIMSEEEIMIFTNMTSAVKEMASAIKETVHSETHPDVYGSIMNLPDFPAESLLTVLEYLMEHKGMSLSFIQMNESMRILCVKYFLARQPKE